MTNTKLLISNWNKKTFSSSLNLYGGIQWGRQGQKCPLQTLKIVKGSKKLEREKREKGQEEEGKEEEKGRREKGEGKKEGKERKNLKKGKKREEKGEKREMEYGSERDWRGERGMNHVFINIHNDMNFA